jgi:type I restriction enzyme, S subunit
VSEKLTHGWARVPLESVAQCDWGNTTLTKAAYRDEGVTAFSATGPDGLVKDAEHDGEGIVLSAIGANCGKCFFAGGQWTAIKNTITIVPKSEVALARFMFFQLNRRELWPKRGGSQPFIGLGDTRELAVSVPPLNEQRRIVAKLEALQARSRRAREALDAVPPLLEKLRQSILAAAFRGDLTKDWRAKHKDVEPASELLKRIRVERRKKWEESELTKMKAKGKAPKDDTWKAKYKEPAPVETAGLPELPSGWCWASLESLTDAERGIPYGIVLTGDPVADGIPTVRCGDIRRFSIDLDGLKRVSPKVAKEFDRTRLQGGEVLIAIRGTVGATAVATELMVGMNISREVAMLPTLAGLTPRYLMFCLAGPEAQARVMKQVKGVAQAGINLADLRTLPVPLAPVPEQATVLAVLERHLATCASLEHAHRATSDSCGGLDRGVLTKAFRGELVPQDPSDEPAEVMLARVRDANGPATSEAKAKRGRKAAGDGR